MRRAARTDANHVEIINAFRALGCSVQDLSAVGRGVPDIIVGHRGANYLVEIKDGSKHPSARRLTSDQVTWHNAWRGQNCVIKSVDEVVGFLNKITKKN